MTYILGTTTNKVRWYTFNPNRPQDGYKLVDELNLSQTPTAGDKATAKEWAKGLGLSTWRYFKF